MLADGGDSLGKEAKNWLERPVGREIKVTSGARARGSAPWSSSSLKGPTDKLSRPGGCRGHVAASGSSAQLWPAKAAPLCERSRADTQGGRRTQIRWHRNWGPLARRRAPACGGGCTLGSRRKCDCTSYNGFLQATCCRVQKPQNVCANPLGSDPTSSLLGCDINGALAKPQPGPLPPNMGFQFHVSQMGHQHIESDPVLA